MRVGLRELLSGQIRRVQLIGEVQGDDPPLSELFQTLWRKILLDRRLVCGGGRRRLFVRLLQIAQFQQNLRATELGIRLGGDPLIRAVGRLSQESNRGVQRLLVRGGLRGIGGAKLRASRPKQRSIRQRGMGMQRLQRGERRGKLPQFHLAHALAQPSVIGERRLWVLFEKRREPRQRIRRLLLFEQQHGPMKLGLGDVLGNRPCQLFQPCPLFGLALQRGRVLQLLLSGRLLLEITGDNRFVGRRRFGAFRQLMMGASEQVLRVDAKHGVGEWSELAERADGERVIAELKSGVSEQIVCQRQVAAGSERGVRDQRGEQIGRLFPLLLSQQHLRLVAACAGRPVRLRRDRAVGRRRRFRPSSPGRMAFAKPLRGLRELLQSGLLQRCGFVRLGHHLGQRIVSPTAVGQPEIVQRFGTLRKIRRGRRRRQRLGHRFVVPWRDLQQRQPQAVPSRLHSGLVGMFLRELAIAVGGDVPLLFVVRSVTRVQHQRRLFFGRERRLRGQRASHRE